MVAYEVFLNDKRLCLAGIDGDGVLNAILSYGRGGQVDYLRIPVGGLISATKEQLQWTCPHLKIGDEVKVRIIDATSVDEPMSHHVAPEFDSESEKAHVRWWVKKLGWTVIERPM